MIFSKYKKTKFVAGFLRPEEVVLGAQNTLEASKKFVAPRKIDTRDRCIQSSNQQQTPHCAGYSTAGYIEVRNWKKLHYPEQVDGDAIYVKAKEFDSYAGDGTSLSCAVRGAIALGLIKGTEKYVAPTVNDIKFAMHEYDVCIAGFMITSDWNSVDKRTGVIRNSGNRAKKLGGHAVLLCGYNKHGVYIQNSWGTDWGLHGFALLGWEQVNDQFMSGMVVIEK